MVAEYSRDVAEGLESMAQSLGRRDVDALVGSVEDFGRAPSVAFLGGAVVGGFAPACFFHENSAGRRHQPSDDIRQSYTASSGGRNAEHINCGDAPLGDGYGQQREGAV
jgi:hypothetical protein